MLVDQLNLKERTAIELRYLGNTHAQVAEKIETSVDTVENWFSSNGKLLLAFQEYRDEMNKKRQANMEKSLYMTDEAIATITSNIMISVGKKMQKRLVPLVNKQGQAVADDNGKPIMIEVEPDTDFSVQEFKAAWEMQRIQQGMPTTYQKSDVVQTNIEADGIMRELNLTPEDFTNERIADTRKRIAEHIAKYD